MGDPDHWNRIYDGKPEAALSWHQDDPAVSVALLQMAGLSPASAVIDIGAGTSRLPDALLSLGVSDLTVLDLSEAALAWTRDRLGAVARATTFIAADITAWRPARTWDLWHDRAVFHFLVDPADRAAYADAMASALPVGGHAIIATFDLDGPATCSGLPVQRYSPGTLAAEFAGIPDGSGSGTAAAAFVPVAHRAHRHETPWGSPQAFQYSLLRRT